MKYYIKVLQHYADFSGRANRSEYWYFMLFHLIISFVLAFISAMMHSMLLYDVYILAIIIPGLAVAVRRMHDTGRNGWYSFIPIYNIILACTEGRKGDNEYGPDPQGPGEGDNMLTDMNR